MKKFKIQFLVDIKIKEKSYKKGSTFEATRDHTHDLVLNYIAIVVTYEDFKECFGPDRNPTGLCLEVPEKFKEKQTEEKKA